MEIARVSEIASTERILRRRMLRQTLPSFVVTLNISISIYFIGHIFPPSFSKPLLQNSLDMNSASVIEKLALDYVYFANKTLKLNEIFVKKFTNKNKCL